MLWALIVMCLLRRPRATLDALDAEFLERDTADQVAKQRVLESVKGWNKRRRKSAMQQQAKTATVVTGFLRAGRFESVAANIRDSIFSAMAPGTTDVFWMISDAPRLVDGTALQTLDWWGPQISHAFVEFTNAALYRRIETNCSLARDESVSFQLRSCLPARAQFLAMARAWTLVVEAENKQQKVYEWILRIRPDMVHKKQLPSLDTWTSAPKLAYLDGWRWFRNCSAASHCTCFCAGDRFGIVSRKIAPIVFGIAATLLKDEGCSPSARCPRHFLEDDQDACYKSTIHMFPECILGAALLQAGLDPSRDLRKLHSGDLISCGSPMPPIAGDAKEQRVKIHRTSDDEPCQAAYWRHERHRQELGPSLMDHPIPGVKKKIVPFWEEHYKTLVL